MKRPQSGAALLTAMIIVTLIASLAAAMVWQQYRAVQIEAADRARAQSAWILQGALEDVYKRQPIVSSTASMVDSTRACKSSGFFSPKADSGAA